MFTPAKKQRAQRFYKKFDFDTTIINTNSFLYVGMYFHTMLVQPSNLSKILKRAWVVAQIRLEDKT